MPLRLTLKPQERVIIGGAVIHNRDLRADLLIENEVPVLRESDILSPKLVRTFCERIYLALQLMYVDEANASQNGDAFRLLSDEVAKISPSLKGLLKEIRGLVDEGRLYQALKRAKELINRERELLGHV